MSNIVHIVESYKLTMTSPEERNKVWYGAIELAKFFRDEFHCQFDGTAEEAAAAYEAHCAEKRKRMSVSSSLPSSLTNEQKFQMKTQDIMNRRLTTSQHFFNLGARQSSYSNINNSKTTVPVPNINAMMSTREALAAARRHRNHHRNNHLTNLACIENRSHAIQPPPDKNQTTTITPTSSRVNHSTLHHRSWSSGLTARYLHSHSHSHPPDTKQ